MTDEGNVTKANVVTKISRQPVHHTVSELTDMISAMASHRLTRVWRPI